MTTISNDSEFRRIATGPDQAGQSTLAARFLEHVLPLAGDGRIERVAAVAARPEAQENELRDALHQARTVAVEMHSRCGAEGNWRDQAGYFVARAALAAVTPAAQLPGDAAWQTAMSSRMAGTCLSIDVDEDTAGSEQQAQYHILSEFLDTRGDEGS